MKVKNKKQYENNRRQLPKNKFSQHKDLKILDVIRKVIENLTQDNFLIIAIFVNSDVIMSRLKRQRFCGVFVHFSDNCKKGTFHITATKTVDKRQFFLSL